MRNGNIMFPFLFAVKFFNCYFHTGTSFTNTVLYSISLKNANNVYHLRKRWLIGFLFIAALQSVFYIFDGSIEREVVSG